MKKKLLAVLGVTAVAAASVGTTLAFLEDQTETIENVYELGNVSIKQLEYERAVDETGNWISTGAKDNWNWVPDELQEFTNSKPLLPAVFLDGTHKWDDRNGSQATSGETSHMQSWGQVGAPGANQLFDGSMKNVQDHFVFVENDGNTNAYARTWFAFEQGSLTDERMGEIIGINMNTGHWTWTPYASGVEITTNGVTNKYDVIYATYVGPNRDGIISADEITRPNLLQIYIAPEATNEDMVAVDGNGNGKYDVLVKTQAIQAGGFPDAETALAEFGTEHPF